MDYTRCVTHCGVQSGFEVFPDTLEVASETPGSDWLLVTPVLICYHLAFPVTVKALGSIPVLPLLKMTLPELLTALLLLRAPPFQPLPTSISQAFPTGCPKSSGQPTSPAPKLQDHGAHLMGPCPPPASTWTTSSLSLFCSSLPFCSPFLEHTDPYRPWGFAGPSSWSLSHDHHTFLPLVTQVIAPGHCPQSSNAM